MEKTKLTTKDKTLLAEIRGYVRLLSPTGTKGEFRLVRLPAYGPKVYGIQDCNDITSHTITDFGTPVELAKKIGHNKDAAKAVVLRRRAYILEAIEKADAAKAATA